ncbi:soluble lytic murein transglycosylase and related regulatory protein [Leptotrichia trevisanii]|uniref:Soluble lytic murein transglycosylase and related regulatory protein n=1 Tax=Leptotrichia trevisanii TaxID=109328 RepID=A0A510KMY4_9FUSO|nr:transglycosylase SLT domain-containing protein [Leptotrichia trevisanii]BBM44158.1 soluble lytic murein transglycosylase and related regulatory protein [Leptotrichia trevisanii]BBM51303.1 soluble lytic murein transglycosylase and related regulatory protein [Leptotrichia trevisanii]
MKKCILFLMIVSKISFSGGEISFQKQKEKIEQERIEKLKTQTDSNADKSKELDDLPKGDTSNIQSQSNKLFYDDKFVKKINNASHIQKNIGNRKLVEYIKTQNSRLNENEIQSILDYVFKYSREYNFNPYLVLAVMNTESHFNHSTVSSAGARGLMQLMPFNFKEFGVDNSISGNIKGGVLHLKRDYEKTGSISKMLVCYNAGCGRLANNAWKGIKETREYIPKVIQKYNKIKNL